MHSGCLIPLMLRWPFIPFCNLFFFFVLDLYFYVRMGKWEFSLYGTFLSRVSI